MRRRRPSASTQPRAAWRSIIRDILLSSAPLSTNETRVGMLEREGPLELSSSRQIALCGLLGTLSIGKGLSRSRCTYGEDTRGIRP